MADELQPKTLVRRYSEKVADEVEACNGNTTAVKKLVAEDVRIKQQRERDEAVARKRFEAWQQSADGADTLVHDKLARELNEAWMQFRREIPVEERVGFDSRVPPFEEIDQAMTAVATKWEKSRTKGKGGAIFVFYRRCCVCLKAHETMLKILPEGDKYFSLLTGVLKSVVFATANHEKIALALSRSIAEISEIVGSCIELRDMFQTQRMQELTMRLYAQIFRFFRDVMKWYLERTWKRLLKSLNEDLYDTYESQIVGIRETAQSMKDTAWTGQASEVHIVRLNVEDLQQRVEELRLQSEEDRRRRREETIASENALFSKIRGLIYTGLLDQAANYILCARTPRQLLHAASPDDFRMEAGNLVELHEVTRDALLVASRHLEDYFDRRQVLIEYDPTCISGPSEAVGGLEDWIKTKGSSLLYIVGPEETHTLEASEVSTLAARIIDLIVDSKLPVISYFCEPRRDTARDGVSPRVGGTAALIYALLRQALEIVDPKFETSKDLLAVSKFDGSIDEFDQALEHLDTALQNGGPVVYCVIDGLQEIEDMTTSIHLEKLVKYFRVRAAANGEQKSRLRVLFTTSGHCSCLIRNLNRSEIIFADDERSYAGRRLRNTEPLMLPSLN